MTKITSTRRVEKSWYLLLLLALLLAANIGWAAPVALQGSWYEAPGQDWLYQGPASLDDTHLTPVTGVSLTGGHYLFRGGFSVPVAGRYVLDFKNTSTIGRFRQLVFDQDNRLVAKLEGGIQSGEENPFFLRNGRELVLAAGQYRLVSELISPFFLAQPEPYLDGIMHYRASIKLGNALVLVGLGVFLGLGVYYAALGAVRRRVAEGMYSLFILGNILYNSTSLLVFPDLFGIHNIYLLSMPILFSNMAYIIFVMALLEIDRNRHSYLFRAAVGIIAVMLAMLVWAIVYPSESLQMDRYGVGLFLSYGLVAGLVREIQGNVTAKFYLIAIAIFFILGGMSITQKRLGGVYSLSIEHMGLLAVVVEVILLALVVAYQFGQLQREKEAISQHLEHSRRIANTDILTGLPNRFAMDKELERLPNEASLTFIDLDRLKYYNDNFGHARGDELLSHFARKVAQLLDGRAKVFRVGGDEFAVICPGGDLAWVEARIAQAVEAIQEEGFEFAGASAGSASFREAANLSELKHLADMRMYDSKQSKSLD